MIQLFLGLFLIFTQKVYSQTCDAHTSQGIEACFAGVFKASAGANLECECTEIENQCKDKMKRLTSDGTIDIPIIGGYADMNGRLDDELFGNEDIAEIKENLLKPCPNTFIPNNSWNLSDSEERAAAKDEKETRCNDPFDVTASCGFLQTDDPEILIRRVKIGDKLQNVRVRLVVSELTGSDKENRNNINVFISDRVCASLKSEALKKVCIQKSKLPTTSLVSLEGWCRPQDENRYQICRSRYARDALRTAISSGAEFPMFSGHARMGGGPSFDPPVVLSSGHIDYAWYKKNRPGHQLETQAFIKAVASGKPPVFYGSFSCDGITNFWTGGNFPEASPETAFVLSRRVTLGDESVRAILSSIDGVLSGMCGKDLSDWIQTTSCSYISKETKP